MAQDKDKTVNTVEELMALAVCPYGNETRYQFKNYSSWKYDDAVAGKAHDDEGNAIMDKHSANEVDYWGQPDYVAWCKKPGPAKRRVDNYSLYHRSGGWHGSSISLGNELGKQIEAVWTKKKPRYGSTPQPVGVLTLSGILKRLGHTDVGDKIKAAKDAEAAKYALNRRNNARRTVLAKVAELEKAMAEAKVAGVFKNSDDAASTFLIKLKNTPELALEDTNTN